MTNEITQKTSRSIKAFEENNTPLPNNFKLNMSDCNKLEKLASMGLTATEIASVLDVSSEGLLQNDYYRYRLERGRNQIKIALRRKQLDLALDGNVQLLIHLGKNMLDQSDNVKIDSNNKGVEITIVDLTKRDEKTIEQ